ncbi:MAG: serine/threonine protein kinase [Deltaproteobacteria bacterium]|nr:serine/threonine protein kinase [Deltaproteobacteria bacterium]
MNDQGKESLAPGMVLGHRYELIRRLRSEAHGEVFLGRDQVLEVDVGLKFLSNEDPEFDRLLEFYRREAVAGLKLHHPQILGVHQLDETAEGVFLLQEPFVGNSLWELLGQSEALTVNDSLYFIEVLAQGLTYGHKQGVVHQNFNPQQVLVSATEGIKIINFTFPVEPLDMNTFPELQAYIAPEIWRGGHSSVASNLFSLGVIGYRMLSGALPFPLAAEGAFPYHLTPEPHQLETIPEALRPLFIRCLKGEPEKRFHSGADFLARLGALREKLMPSGVTRAVRFKEEPGKVGDKNDESAFSQAVVIREPEVDLDAPWKEDVPAYRPTFGEKVKAWAQDHYHRVLAFLGPEPLRHNRKKQRAAMVGAALGFLLLLLGLNSLFSGRPKLELARTPEVSERGASVSPWQEPEAAKPPVDAPSPGLGPEIKPESVGPLTSATQAPRVSEMPEAPAPMKAPAAVPEKVPTAAPVKVPAAAPAKTPAVKPAPPAGAKPVQLAARPARTADATAKGKTPETSARVKLAATFAKETDARKHADALTRQGQRAVVKKSTKGNKPLYQVWLTAAAPAKPAATASRPVTATPKPKAAPKPEAARPR